MTEQLFVNKYQPIYFKDFQNNDEIIKILNTLILIDNLNILIMGETASGKTSFLNAIVKEYYSGNNPKEYEDNVLYINNLKEQGISYYRSDVKTFCQTCSNIKNKKKIIILDDIDTINEQSQQVFRNCIDKYSHNVNFISSCKNNQKVIESLQSRLTIIKINNLQKEQMNIIVNKIKHNENIIIEEDAQQFIVNISVSSVKLLINYMEKIKLIEQPITLQLATLLCSNISFVIFEEYTNFILAKQLTSAITLINDIFDKGYSVMDILDNYFIFVKSTNILNETQKYEIIPYICKYISIFHNIHEHEIELFLFTNNIFKALHP